MSEAFNLDQLAARTAQDIIEKAGYKVENLITKTLGVLQENGVYAAVLFLLSRTSGEKEMAEKDLLPQLIRLLAQPELQFLGIDYKGPINFTDNRDRSVSKLLTYVADTICNDIDKLFLIKKLYEQVLIYARYGAKAAKEDSQQEDRTSS